MIKTVFVNPGCFGLLTEITLCVLIISLHIYILLGRTKEGIIYLLQKAPHFSGGVKEGWAKRGIKNGVTGKVTLSLEYMPCSLSHLRESLSVTLSLCVWHFSLIKYVHIAGFTGLLGKWAIATNRVLNKWHVMSSFSKTLIGLLQKWGTSVLPTQWQHPTLTLAIVSRSTLRDSWGNMESTQPDNTLCVLFIFIFFTLCVLKSC